MDFLCLNPLLVQPPWFASKHNDAFPFLSSSSSSCSSSLNVANGGCSSKGALKPIVITGCPPTIVSAPDRRIVAVGDLHGDLDQARSALEIAGVLSSEGQNLWTGGETVVGCLTVPHVDVCPRLMGFESHLIGLQTRVLIQLGDILDRGEDEIAILSLLRSLDMQAKEKGGAVFQVNGNHETMNVEGDYRYVDSGAFHECTDFLEYMNDYNDNREQAFLSWINECERWKENRKMSSNYWDQWNILKRQKEIIARSILFRPGGLLACELARHSIVLKVNDWIFCHGGLLPHHAEYGIERINNEVSCWMRGPSDDDEDEHHSDPIFPFIATRGYDSVVWNRLYSRDSLGFEDYEVNSILEETLKAVGAKAMVVGHTPQSLGINCKYNCSLWRVDVGMSSGVLNSRPEVLEIREDQVRVIKSKKDRHNEAQVVDFL